MQETDAAERHRNQLPRCSAEDPKPAASSPALPWRGTPQALHKRQNGHRREEQSGHRRIQPGCRTETHSNASRTRGSAGLSGYTQNSHFVYLKQILNPWYLPLTTLQQCAPEARDRTHDTATNPNLVLPRCVRLARGPGIAQRQITHAAMENGTRKLKRREETDRHVQTSCWALFAMSLCPLTTNFVALNAWENVCLHPQVLQQLQAVVESCA